MNFIRFLTSVMRINSIQTDPSWLEPQNETEFTNLLDSINTLNSSNPEFPINMTWNGYSIWLKYTLNLESMDKLRNTRNQLLTSTDWLLTYDNVQSLANLDDWVKYRQALRDIFKNVSDISSLQMPVQPPILRKTDEGTQGAQGTQ